MMNDQEQIHRETCRRYSRACEFVNLTVLLVLIVATNWSAYRWFGWHDVWQQGVLAMAGLLIHGYLVERYFSYIVNTVLHQVYLGANGDL